MAKGFPYALPAPIGFDNKNIQTGRKKRHAPGGAWYQRVRGVALNFVQYGPFVSVRPPVASASAEANSRGVSFIAGGRVKPLPGSASAAGIAPKGVRADQNLGSGVGGVEAVAIPPVVQSLAPVDASYTFSGSVTPDEQFAAFGYGYRVSKGVALEVAGPLSKSRQFSGGVYRSPMASRFHSARATMNGGAGSTDRGVGVVVAGNSVALDTAVFVTGHLWDSNRSTQIFTKVGDVVTERAFNGAKWDAGDEIECRIFQNPGGIYVYVVYKNGVQALSWIDHDRVIRRPGRFCGFVFQHIASGGVQWYSQGIKGTWYGADII
jgi:hypothetical protein